MVTPRASKTLCTFFQAAMKSALVPRFDELLPSGSWLKTNRTGPGSFLMPSAQRTRLS